jgi:S1-C subfamily serine protease
MALYDPYAPGDPPPPPDDAWTYPGPGGHPAAPPPAWPYYWDPAPPSRMRRRSLAAIVALLLTIALVGAGVGVAVSRLAGSAAKLNDPVVDVNVALGSGDAAAGTGIILTSSGQILTNNHVVENSQRISVQVNATTTYTATVIGVDPSDDIAVLQVQQGSGLPAANIGDSSHLQVGDSVTAVGNALGRGGTPQSAQGRVTALDQTITATDDTGSNSETLTNMIQFDATIQPGDSGGPLYNSSGQVVGMDTAGSGHVGRRALGSNQGFAIPINSAITIARQITSGANAPNVVRGHRGLLGVEVQESTSPAGALVVSVQAGSPAENAGISANDVIVSVAGRTVDSVNSLRQGLQNHNPGESVTVSWLDTSGQQHNATVQLTTGGIP